MRRPSAYRWAFRKAYRGSERIRIGSNCYSTRDKQKEDALNNVPAAVLVVFMIIGLLIFVGFIGFLMWVTFNGGAFFTMVLLILYWIFS